MKSIRNGPDAGAQLQIFDGPAPRLPCNSFQEALAGCFVAGADSAVHGKRAREDNSAGEPVCDVKKRQNASNLGSSLDKQVAGLVSEGPLNGPLPSRQVEWRSFRLLINKTVPARSIGGKIGANCQLPNLLR